jgi:hypothetical protein
VYWWKRVSREVDFPYRAEVVAVGPRRVTILTEPPGGGAERVVRHVRAECLQPVGGYFLKAARQGPAWLEPMRSWGRFTRYLDVGADLHALRHVDEYENGARLSYDRRHWVDGFGMLADARVRRGDPRQLHGPVREISAAEFEPVWKAARRSPLRPRQRESERMSRMGEVPLWLVAPRA